MIQEFEVFPLNEGYYTIGFDKVFVPFSPGRDRIEDRSKGSLQVEVQPFLVRTRNHNILFDTGLGFKNEEGELVLLENLKKYNLGPKDIDCIIMSHLHKDHAGGLTYLNDNNIRVETFPNAIYYISKKEFRYALETSAPSYDIEDLSLLKDEERICWLDREGSILDFIHYTRDGGHCPYHTSFLLKGVKNYFFGGDVVPQISQLKIRYIAKYDADGKLSADLRDEYAAKGRKEGWTFMFYHDVDNPFGSLD